MSTELPIVSEASRRDFLKQACSVFAGIVIVGSALPLLEGCSSNSNPVSAPTLQGKMLVVDVADLTADNTAKVLSGSASPTGSPWLVIRRSVTIYETIILVCKHQGAVYPEINYNGTLIACSRHGSQYDRDGHVTHGPAAANLDTYVTSFDATTNKVTIHY